MNIKTKYKNGDSVFFMRGGIIHNMKICKIRTEQHGRYKATPDGKEFFPEGSHVFYIFETGTLSAEIREDLVFKSLSAINMYLSTNIKKNISIL